MGWVGGGQKKHYVVCVLKLFSEGSAGHAYCPLWAFWRYWHRAWQYLFKGIWKPAYWAQVTRELSCRTVAELAIITIST